MRIAFYAPMKPPDHPLPSGDRRMARALFSLLRELGHEPFLASRLRSWDGRGDPLRQRRIARIAARMAERLLRRWGSGEGPRPGLWFTYHLYHKAPDHLGPRIARALRIPYVVAEASLAPRAALGPWALGHRAARAALHEADAVLLLTGRDREALLSELGPAAPLFDLPPFLSSLPPPPDRRPEQRAALARRFGLRRQALWLLTVAMMRPGAKLRSYGFLAQALAPLGGLDWQLLVVGDGPARSRVEEMFARFAPRVRLAGRLEGPELEAAYAACDLFLWPGFEEAYGMVYLEAQAAGLPVIALRTHGVPEVVVQGEGGILVSRPDPGAYAAAVARLAADGAARADLAARGRRHVELRHGPGSARAVLERALARACAAKAEARA